MPRSAAGAAAYMGAPETQVDEVLLDLMMAFLKDQNDPSIKDKLQALQQVLGAKRGLCMSSYLQTTVWMLRDQRA